MTDELRDQVARERQTETEIRKLDTSQVVEWIHGLEDGYADLELQVDRLRDTLAQSQAARAEAEECANRLRAELAEQWTASSTDYDRSIHHNPDAAAWADLFMQTYPNCGADRDTMLGWFANAIMSMYDSKIAPVEAERDRAMQACEQMGQQLAERDGQRPHMWAVEQQVEGQFIQGRPRKVWWECNDGIGQAFYAAPPSPRPAVPVTHYRNGLARDSRDVDSDPEGLLIRNREEPLRPAVPSGWKLVPDQPTHAMLEAGEFRGLTANHFDRAHKIYSAMLEAAPTPPADGEAQCPMGDGCDLTVAYMAGFARGKDASGDGREAWRPIESAPRDGSKFLAYEEGHWYAARYFDPEVLEAYCGQPVVQPPEPTHWQPLPAPPAAQAEKGGV